jgi:flagellar hook-length control protein FliK
MATDDAIVIPLATTPQPATPPVAVTPAVTLTPAGTIEIKPEFVAKADAATPPVPAQPVATPAVEISLNAPTLASRPALAATLAIAIDGPAAPRRLIREIAGATFAPTAPDSPSAPAVAATADMQQAALDTRRQEWMGSMIDRIETMRDASSTGDTRIRLSPEALGPVDISIRHEGDKIHVHFATETSAARQLLTDAQPRLAEIAEARGVKLGQTSVDGGNAGAGAGQQQAAAQQQTLSNRPASALSDDGAIDADQRIA